MRDYHSFIAAKRIRPQQYGFEVDVDTLNGYLFDWQARIVQWALRRGRAAIFAECGLGKGLRPECPILTPNGFVALASLAVGDMVVGSNGCPTQVIGVYPRGTQKLYRVTFSDGVSIVCDSDHLWNVKNPNDIFRCKPWRTMRTEDIARTQLKYGTHGQSRTWKIPLVEPVQHPSTTLPLDPYLLGVLLGDGNFGATIRWTNNDVEIAKRIGLTLPEGVSLSMHASDSRATTWAITTPKGYHNPVLTTCRELGLDGKKSWEKFVPGNYLTADVRSRVALLQGLMDTDGYAGESPEFSSSSQSLAISAQQLVESLGGTASINVKESPTYQHAGETKTGRSSYRVIITLPPGIEPFSLPRKAKNYRTASRGLGRWIDSIQPCGCGDTICIEVAASDGLFVIDRYVVTHNTICQLEWAAQVCHETGGRVLIHTPCGVRHQTLREAEHFGIDVPVRIVDDANDVQWGISLVNYEKLHRFDTSEFVGVVLDESSILKASTGKTRTALIKEWSHARYRLCCTATPAPNDHMELGNHAEFLGVMNSLDMLSRWFVHDGGDTSKWRLRKHAVKEIAAKNLLAQQNIRRQPTLF